MRQKIKDAIQESINTNSVVTIEEITSVVVSIASEMGYQVDYIETEQGIDLWGWTDETEENEQDWRLLLK